MVGNLDTEAGFTVNVLAERPFQLPSKLKT